MSTLSQQRKAKKRELIKKIYDRLSKHKQIIIVTLMNVGSNQVQDFRHKLLKRQGELVIGKNVSDFFIPTQKFLIFYKHFLIL